MSAVVFIVLFPLAVVVMLVVAAKLDDIGVRK